MITIKTTPIADRDGPPFNSFTLIATCELCGWTDQASSSRWSALGMSLRIGKHEHYECKGQRS